MHRRELLKGAVAVAAVALVSKSLPAFAKLPPAEKPLSVEIPKNWGVLPDEKSGMQVADYYKVMQDIIDNLMKNNQIVTSAIQFTPDVYLYNGELKLHDRRVMLSQMNLKFTNGMHQVWYCRVVLSEGESYQNAVMLDQFKRYWDNATPEIETIANWEYPEPDPTPWFAPAGLHRGRVTDLRGTFK